MKDAFLKKLERQVTGAFDIVRLTAEAAGETFARTPYTDERFSIQDDPALLAHGVCLALAARVSFRQEASPDLPELPLASAEREKLIGSKNAEFAVLGFFGRSRASGNWGPHPVFRIYARGLMKCEYTPERI